MNFQVNFCLHSFSELFFPREIYLTRSVIHAEET